MYIVSHRFPTYERVRMCKHSESYVSSMDRSERSLRSIDFEFGMWRHTSRRGWQPTWHCSGMLQQRHSGNQLLITKLPSLAEWSFVNKLEVSEVHAPVESSPIQCTLTEPKYHPLVGPWPVGLYFRDGSGGCHTSYEHLRRCGSGVTNVSVCECRPTTSANIWYVAFPPGPIQIVVGLNSQQS